MNDSSLIRLVVLVFGIVSVAAVSAQKTGDIYTGVAAVKSTSGSTSETPMAFTLERKMSKGETDALLAAFKTAGAAGLRKALAGVAPTGAVRVGAAKPVAARITLERASATGKLITIVTDQPVQFFGIGMPAATPKAGYDFAVIDLIVDAKGNGTGTITPAATVTVKQGVFTVADGAADAIRLTGVTKVR
jgi:hypothetical protein